MRKLYIYTNMKSGEGIYYAMADDGVVLANHYCSSMSFAIGDLIGNRPERKRMYENHFGGERGEAFEVILLAFGELPPKEVLELNEKLPPEKIIDNVKAKVEMSYSTLVVCKIESFTFNCVTKLIDQAIADTKRACKQEIDEHVVTLNPEQFNFIAGMKDAKVLIDVAKVKEK